MNISTSYLPQSFQAKPAVKPDLAASQAEIQAVDAFTPSSGSRTLERLETLAGVAVAGAAGGAIASFAPGYWSVPAGLLSGAATGAGAPLLAGALSEKRDPYLGLLVIGTGLWGGVSGVVGGVGTNLLESFTGLPRLAAGAIGGAAANLALYALASAR